MRVFTDRVRTDPSPSANTESTFDFYDRVSGSFWDDVRSLIEEWFSRLDPSAQSDVRGRLRSRDNRQFNSAHFELYLNESLLRMGYAVTCHPSVSGTTRRPDFRAEKSGHVMYVEARSASRSDEVAAAAARLNQVYDSLNKIDSPNFYVGIDVTRAGALPFGARPLRRRLEAWLGGLDPDEPPVDRARRGEFPSMTHEDEASGWAFDLWAMAKPVHRRGQPGLRPLGMMSGGVDSSGLESSLQGALSDKGSAYGDLDGPFVVAVAIDEPWLTDGDVTGDLYGTSTVDVEHVSDGSLREVRRYRASNGYWSEADGSAVHRGVSAVLVVKSLHPAFVHQQEHTIWEHPGHRLAVPDLPLWRRAFQDVDGEPQFASPRRDQAEWFGLAPHWPSGEAFPDA